MSLNQYIVYAFIGIFAYLIINWVFNIVHIGIEGRTITREGIGGASGGEPDDSTTQSNSAKGKTSPSSSSSSASSSASTIVSKCPSDCTSVKELQQKLADATKKVGNLEEDIIANTNASTQHAKAIAELNQSINEMQTKQKDE